MIDLRSDTVTKPSKEMLEIMLSAPLGDDVYGEDPSVNELQEYAAELSGKEAAIFMPSGTMTNQVGIKINTEAGDELICENDAHIYYYETAAPSIISRVQIRPVPSKQGMPLYEDIENTIRPDVYYYPKTTLICLENTHNRHGGTVLKLDEIEALIGKLKANHPDKFRYHLDGARLWNAAIASGNSIKEYCHSFDTISLCLSKGLGAPVGSVLCGERKYIDKALKWRKILGGGMRQSGILAKAALYAIENNFPKLGEDHENATTFANGIIISDYLDCDLSTVQTNMVALKCVNGLDADKMIEALLKNGIPVNGIGNNSIRAVFHLDINKEETEAAINIFKETAENLM